MEKLRGRYRLHRFPPRFPAGTPRVSGGADYQQQLMNGYQQGLEQGLRQGREEGYEQGYQEGKMLGHAEGQREGYTAGSLAGQQQAKTQFDDASGPLDALGRQLNDYLAHLQQNQRSDLLALVERVTRQVIRCELALQPTQLLALVEEAVSAIPTAPQSLQVLLNPQEFERINGLAPEKVREWGLVPSEELKPGECRVLTDTSELDIGCEQRLAQCLTRLNATLAPERVNE